MSLYGKGLEYINKLFKEDNLELLRRLPDECIDLIYCDILYNTGRKFNDYDDNLGTPQEAIEWYKPRLSEMKRVLRKSGSIYLQCDFRLVHYLKVEMDNIFGSTNFRNEIIWHYKRWTGKAKKYQSLHDNILFYTKTNNYNFNILYKDYTEGSKRRKEHTLHRFKNGEKYLVTENNGVPENDVWCDIPFIPPSSKERVGYDTQKPKELMRRIILSSSNEGDLIADFFCGSGTTCVVAKELGRSYLGCDIGEKAIRTTNQRLKEGEGNG